MNRIFALTAIVIGLTSLTGCMGVASPVIGAVYTEASYGDTATMSTAATKEGKACANSYFLIVATGDASIAAAKANGKITEVSAVDHTAKNILGFGEWCTIVRGK